MADKDLDDSDEFDDLDDIEIEDDDTDDDTDDEEDVDDTDDIEAMDDDEDMDDLDDTDDTDDLDDEDQEPADPDDVPLGSPEEEDDKKHRQPVMTIIGKIFVLLNLLLALTFLSFAVAAHVVRLDLAKRLSEKNRVANELQQKKDKLTKEVVVLKKDLKSKNKKLVERKKTNERDSRKGASDIHEVQERIDKKHEQIDELHANMETTTAELKRRREMAQGLRKQEESLLEEFVILEDRKEKLFNEITQQEVGLDEVLTRNQGLVKRLRELGEPIPPKS